MSMQRESNHSIPTMKERGVVKKDHHEKDEYPSSYSDKEQPKSGSQEWLEGAKDDGNSSCIDND